MMRTDEDHTCGDGEKEHLQKAHRQESQAGESECGWRERKGPRITPRIPAWWCHWSGKRKHKMRKEERRRAGRNEFSRTWLPKPSTVSISRVCLIHWKLHSEESLMLKIITLTLLFVLNLHTVKIHSVLNYEFWKIELCKHHYDQDIEQFSH